MLASWIVVRISVQVQANRKSEARLNNHFKSSLSEVENSEIDLLLSSSRLLYDQLL